METYFRYFDAYHKEPCEFESIGANHRNLYHEILWVKKGNVELLLDGEKIDIPSNCIFLVSQNRIHRYFPSEDTGGSILRFSEDFLDKTPYALFNQFLKMIRVDLNNDDQIFLDHIFHLIKLEYRKDTSLNENRDIIRNLLSALLRKLELIRNGYLMENENVNKSTFDLFESFNSLLEREFENHHSVTFYADQLGISQRKLSETTKNLLAKTAGQVIEERLILEAKRMLLYSPLSVKEIAFELGFEEHSYFTKVFRRNMRSTPSQFRDDQKIT